jgi:hypothetical protein
MKEDSWTRFGYEAGYIRKMSGQEFWDGEYDRIGGIDQFIAQVRGALSV